MILGKAIKILEASLKVSIPDFDQDERDAVKLGIEALKRIKEYRAWKEFPCTTDLPGETEE